MNAVVARPRARLCQKASDGAASVQIMLLQQTVGKGHRESVEVATALLKRGFPVSDAHRMTGFNRTMLRRLSSSLGRDPSERVGRIPSRMGIFLKSPQTHLWTSVFLSRLECFRLHWTEENRTFVSGRTMLSAIRATELACGVFPSDGHRGHVRYLVLAAEQLCEQRVHWVICGPCGTRYFTLKDAEFVGNRLTSGARCPLCAAVKLVRVPSRLAHVSGHLSLRLPEAA